MEQDRRFPLAIEAAEAIPRSKPSMLPEPFASRVSRREKRPLGDPFGLTAFGVNLARLRPGGASALHHRHTREDEFVYVLEGEPTLVSDDGEVQLRPGMCAGFAAGRAAHHLENRTDRDVVWLEVGNRTAGDEPVYPDDDLRLVNGPGGKRVYAHKDGTPY